MMRKRPISYIRPRRHAQQGISGVPAIGDDVVMGSTGMVEMNRRRVIAEQLSPGEQLFFRGEMDVAQNVSLGKRSRTSLSSTTEISDARSILSSKKYGSGVRNADNKKKKTVSDVLKKPQVSQEKEYYECFGRGITVSTELGMVQLDEWARSIETTSFQEWKQGKKEREPMKIEDVVLRDRSGEDRLDGDAIVDLWFQCMGKIEERLTLSEQQKDFIQSCFISLLPLIYGDQFDVNIVRLTKRFGIDAIYKKIFFEMPRRFGKTTSTAIVASIIAYIIPGLTVGIYSIVKSASDSLVESVIDYYSTISGMDQMDFITEWNKQKGRVCLKNATGTTSTVWGYSAVSTVRFYPSFLIYIYIVVVSPAPSSQKNIFVVMY